MQLRVEPSFPQAFVAWLCVWPCGPLLFPRLFVGKPGGDPRALPGIFRLGRAVAQYAPVVSRAGGTDPRVVPGYGRISGMHLLSVVEIPQKPAGAVRFPFKDLI